MTWADDFGDPSWTDARYGRSRRREAHHIGCGTRSRGDICSRASTSDRAIGESLLESQEGGAGAPPHVVGGAGERAGRT